MTETCDDGPTFIATPKGDELVVMTRGHYDRLMARAARHRQGGAILQDVSDDAMARRRRDEWLAAGKPVVPLGVIRRVRAGDTYLKAFRAFRGLTQSALADKAGIHQGYLSEIETASKAPSEETRFALAVALDIHPLFLSDAAPFPNSPP